LKYFLFIEDIHNASDQTNLVSVNN